METEYEVQGTRMLKKNAGGYRAILGMKFICAVMYFAWYKLIGDMVRVVFILSLGVMAFCFELSFF